jgi:hypothetical protein
MIKISKNFKYFPNYIQSNTEQIIITFTVKNIGNKDIFEKIKLVPI